MAHSVRLWLETRMFVITAVYIQRCKLFKGLECALLFMVLCTRKNSSSHSIRVGHSPDFGLPSVSYTDLSVSVTVRLKLVETLMKRVNL